MGPVPDMNPKSCTTVHLKWDPFDSDLMKSDQDQLIPRFLIYIPGGEFLRISPDMLIATISM